MRTVQSTIEEVTVYSRGATIHRRVELAAEGAAFPERVSIPGLPLALIDATVRVSIVSFEGGSDPVVTGVRVGLYVAPKSDLVEPPADAEIQRIQRALEVKRAEIEDLEVESGVLDGMRVPERPEPEEGKPPPPSPMAARVALEGLVDSGRQERRDRVRALTDEIIALEKERRALVARRDEASDAKRIHTNEITKTVALSFDQTDGVTSAVLRVDYHVRGARWAPAYQIRLAKDASDAQIVQRALVCQRTGEDWSGVKLSLSTARPMAWTELPELTAIRIGKRQAPPPARRGFRPPPAGASALYANYDAAREQSNRLAPSDPHYSAPALAIEPPQAAATYMPRDEITANSYVGAAAMAELADDEGYDGYGKLSSDIEPEEEMMMAAPEPSQTRTGVAYRSARPAAPQKRKRKAPRRVSRSVEEAQRADAMLTTLYTELTLGAPQDPQRRGRLLPIDARSTYLETLDLSGRRLDHDVLDVVERATARARSAYDVDLPRDAVDVEQSSGAFDYTYAADERLDVASDGAFHSVPLGTRTSPSDVRYVVVPREDTNVFRIASLENPLYAPLLAGPAELYVGGEYVLTTTLPTVAPQGKLTLGLGVEQAVRCARNARYSETRTSDKVVAMNELVHDLSIELINHLPREIACEVRERIPHPAPDAEVVVEEAQVAPDWEVYDQEERGVVVNGGRRWNVKVAAGEKLELKARYVVKIYANNELAGGNRREA